MGPADVVFFAVLALIGYFLIVRPQRSRSRQLQQVRTSLAVGSRVMTTAGIHATVTSVDDATVELEIAEGVRVTFACAAVVRVLSPAAVTAVTDLAAPAHGDIPTST